MIDDPLNRLDVLRGEDLPQSKLTDEDVRAIRNLVTRRNALKAELRELSNTAIAKQYNVHVRTIDRITSGEAWGHVE